MVKIAITCAVLLVVCQLAAARSFEPETSAAFALTSASQNEPNIDCANSLAVTLREYYTHFAGQVRETFVALNEERERCETLSGTASVVCWGRYRAQIVFIVSDLIDAFRTRTERFEEYSNVLLEQYHRCRVADNDLFQIVDQLVAEMQSDIDLIAVPLNDIQCASALRDQVVEIYEEFTVRLYARFLSARNIRRRCQLLTAQPALDRCWWSFRIEVLFGITDTIRDVQARRENFNRVTLELLEAYYQCRIE